MRQRRGAADEKIFEIGTSSFFKYAIRRYLGWERRVLSLRPAFLLHHPVNDRHKLSLGKRLFDESRSRVGNAVFPVQTGCQNHADLRIDLSQSRIHLHALPSRSVVTIPSPMDAMADRSQIS